MSDYLTRLAERLTVREPAIVPRARSRFEPEAADAGEFGEVFEEQEAERENARPTAFGRHAASAAHREFFNPRQTAAASFDPPAGAQAGTASPGAVQGSSPGAAPRLVFHGPPNEAPHEMPARHLNPGHAPDEAPVEAARHGFGRLAAAGQGTGTTSRVTGADPGAAHPDLPERSSRPAAARSRIVPSAVTAQSPDLRTPAEPSGEETGSDSSTLEISIGRIEVRPPAEPPKASKPGRRAPRLTLEGYIEQRRGGRR